jgi:hypothetical protein
VAAHLEPRLPGPPIGRETPFFTPVQVKSVLPDALAQPWPMGDAPPKDSPLTGLDSAKIAAAVEATFEPAAMTAAFVVTWKGRIVAERYGAGITAQTPLESWSMGKSLTATLMGILIQGSTPRTARALPAVAEAGRSSGGHPHLRPPPDVERDQDPRPPGSGVRSRPGLP